jgi:hypothetical protein
MHRLLSRALAGAVAFATCAPVAGAQVVLGIGTPPDNVVRPSFALAVGASGNVSAMAVSGLPQQSIMTTPLTWSSSDSSVASLMMINPTTYMVTGKRDGVATIRYTSQFGAASVDVTVGAGAAAPVTGTVIQPRLTTTMVAPTTTTAAPTGATTTTRATATRATTTLARAPLATVTGTRAITGETVAPSPARSAPTGFGVQYVAAGQAAFSWRSVPGAAGYLVTDTERHTIMPSGAGTRAIVTDTAMVAVLPAGTKSYRVAPVYLKAGQASIAPDENNVELTDLFSNTAALTVPRWSGRYRITLNGFTVVQETLDNPLEIDGKRDEVYFRTTAQEYDSAGNAIGAVREVKTRTFGDVNTAEWSNPASATYRIQAGSASSKGGLMTGNSYPAGATPWVNGGAPSDNALPLVVWEGWLHEDGNAVAVVPAVWEDDAKPDPFGPERELLKDIGKYATARFPVPVQLASSAMGANFRLVRFRQAATAPVLPADKVGSLIQDGLAKLGIATPDLLQVASFASSAFQGYRASLQQSMQLMLNTKDRPIGMAPRSGGGFEFTPRLLNITFENAEGIIGGGGLTGKGPGVMEVEYVDTSGNGGRYVLYLQVQRLQ